MSRAMGRYELLRPLARGGMAEVYLARRRAAGVEKWLVVKRIRPERSTDVRFLDLFVREARLSMSLTHQNIVPVFDFGRIDDQVFLAMERIEGKDLGSTLARAGGRPLSPILAAFIAGECCQALDYAHHRKGPDGHALGIVHRDVTPRNVLLSWSGEVKLTDFGIAALAGDAASKLLGTPAYMAPEQARGEPLDARADVYAVGLLLREMLTGQRARPGSDRDSIVEAAKLGTLIPWPDDEPCPLAPIVDRATALAPDDRYPDARSMLAALDELIVGLRAAQRGDAPARQLAAWLEQVWADAREDGVAGEADPLGGEHMVSFLDDGPLDVLGTGTVRSLAATAVDDAVQPGTHSTAAEADGDEVRAAATGPAQAPKDAARPPPEAARAQAERAAEPRASQPAAPIAARVAAPPARDRRARRWLAVAIAGAASAGGLALVSRGGDDGGARRRTLAGSPAGAEASAGIEPASGTGPRVRAGAGAAIAPGAGSATHPGTGPGTGSGTGPVVDRRAGGGSPDAPGRPASGRRPAHPAAIADDARPQAVRAAAAPSSPGDVARHPPARGPDDGGPGDATRAADQASATAPALRNVTINAIPWAYFVVDDDPTQHETVKTLQLAPGRHRVKFSNPHLHVERTVTLDVPADRDLAHVERLTE